MPAEKLVGHVLPPGADPVSGVFARVGAIALNAVHAADVHLGDLVVDGLPAPVPFWMSVSQYEYWKHTHLSVDVVRGRGSGFSVEAPEGVRFLIRSRLLTAEELTVFGITARTVGRVG